MKEKKRMPKLFGDPKTSISTLTRYTEIEFAIEFIKHNKLHFSPLSSFPDKMEAKTFEQAKAESNIASKSIPSKIRREIIYASCWYSGDETLQMWDIYGNDKNCLAIQIDFAQFNQIIVNFDNFRVESRFLDSINKLRKLKNKDYSFRISDFKYGLINYIDFKDLSKVKKEFIGRFKSVDFNHEKEFRFIITQNYKDFPQIGLKDLKLSFNSMKLKGIKVIISPYASNDYYEFVRRGFSDYKNVEVICSKLKKYFV